VAVAQAGRSSASYTTTGDTTPTPTRHGGTAGAASGHKENSYGHE